LEFGSRAVLGYALRVEEITQKTETLAFLRQPGAPA